MRRDQQQPLDGPLVRIRLERGSGLRRRVFTLHGFHLMHAPRNPHCGAFKTSRPPRRRCLPCRTGPVGGSVRRRRVRATSGGAGPFLRRVGGITRLRGVRCLTGCGVALRAGIWRLGRGCPMRCSSWSGKRDTRGSGRSMRRRGVRSRVLSGIRPWFTGRRRSERSSPIWSRSSSSARIAARTASTCGLPGLSTALTCAAGSVVRSIRTVRGPGAMQDMCSGSLTALTCRTHRMSGGPG